MIDISAALISKLGRHHRKRRWQSSNMPWAEFAQLSSRPPLKQIADPAICFHYTVLYSVFVFLFALKSKLYHHMVIVKLRSIRNCSGRIASKGLPDDVRYFALITTFSRTGRRLSISVLLLLVVKGCIVYLISRKKNSSGSHCSRLYGNVRCCVLRFSMFVTISVVPFLGGSIKSRESI